MRLFTIIFLKESNADDTVHYYVTRQKRQMRLMTLYYKLHLF